MGWGVGVCVCVTSLRMVDDEGQGQISHTHLLGGITTTPINRVSSMVLPRYEVQGLLS